MPQTHKTHADARDRLTAQAVFPADDPRARAEAAEVRYRAVLAQWFRGQMSSHEVLITRIAMMQAWSRWVDAKLARWREKGAVA